MPRTLSSEIRIIYIASACPCPYFEGRDFIFIPLFPRAREKAAILRFLIQYVRVEPLSGFEIL